MAIKNTVSIDFLSTFLDSIRIFDCHLPGVYSRDWCFKDLYLELSNEKLISQHMRYWYLFR